MAGRGCVILVKILGGANGQGETEDMYLPVALHSPLEVLKQQLYQLVSILPRDQVLILCDLTDPERNSDRLLTGMDILPLRDCGIRNGSVLTLHALGVSAERSQLMIAEAFATRTDSNQSDIRHVLETEITAADANHSYNGIIFDIECTGPYVIEVHSLSIGGMLGRVRVFARDRGWEEDKPTERQNQHWWAHSDSVSRIGWELVADRVCRPSWDRPLEIKFTKPVVIGPHQRRAFYAHSGLPDDLGIQYQSYRRTDIVAQDEYIRLLPGLGHTGSTPFDENQGWYRSYRGLAGAVSYHVRWKGWTPVEHAIFPTPLREAVRTMLLCNLRNPAITAAQRSQAQERSDSVNSSNSSAITRPMVGGATAADAAMMDDQLTAPSPVSSTILVAMEGGTNSQRRLTLFHLPVYVIYYILEFMHYDWFADIPRQIGNRSTAEANTAINDRTNGRSVPSVATMMQTLMLYLGGHGAEINQDDLLQALHYYHSGQLSNGMDDDDEDEDDEDDEDDMDYEDMYEEDGDNVSEGDDEVDEDDEEIDDEGAEVGNASFEAEGEDESDEENSEDSQFLTSLRQDFEDASGSTCASAVDNDCMKDDVSDGGESAKSIDTAVEDEEGDVTAAISSDNDER